MKVVSFTTLGFKKNLNFLFLLVAFFGKNELLVEARYSGNEKHQTPQAYSPPDPIKYPEDYCQQFSDEDEFDYVVVGSGPGGATVARRLAEDPEIKVLLLEAGGNPPPHTDIPSQVANADYEHEKWHFHSVESEDLCTENEGPGCAYLIAKILGGSSVINAMKYVRGNKKDYDDWEKLGCKGWSYNDVLPYFKKSEKYSVLPLLTTKEIKTSKDKNVADTKYHGTTGPLWHASFPQDPHTHALRQAIIEALNKNGIKYNPDMDGESQMGVSDNGGNVDPSGYRSSIPRAFLLHISDNLKVCKYSLAIKIELDDKKAMGIDFRYNGTGEAEKFKARAKREYIISAGALNSAPLLERSGIGRKEVLEKLGVELKHELPGVGENLQDHLGTGQLFKINIQSSAASNPLSTALLSLATFLNTSDPNSSVPDIEITYVVLAPRIVKVIGTKKETSEQLYSLLEGGESLLYVEAVHIRHPNPGSIHITQVEDPTITPEIITNHLTADFERERITKAAQLVRKFMSSDVLKPFHPEPVVIEKCKQYEFNTEEEVICQMRSLGRSFFHNVGSTAMGHKKNPNAVVDPRLRVIGLENVRIVDSGVMPLITRGNTQIPTVMIAEKAADMIKADRKKKN